MKFLIEPKWLFERIIIVNGELKDVFYCRSCGSSCEIIKALRQHPQGCNNFEKREKISRYRCELNESKFALKTSKKFIGNH